MQNSGRVFYLNNAFSLGMLPPENNLIIEVQKLTPDEFNNLLHSENVVNAIGHQGTVDLVNALFNTSFKINRVPIQLNHGDSVLVIQLLTRLPEGKVLSTEEMKDLLNQGKIAFYKVTLE